LNDIDPKISRLFIFALRIMLPSNSFVMSAIGEILVIIITKRLKQTVFTRFDAICQPIIRFTFTLDLTNIIAGGITISLKFDFSGGTCNTELGNYTAQQNSLETFGEYLQENCLMPFHSFAMLAIAEIHHILVIPIKTNGQTVFTRFDAIGQQSIRFTLSLHITNVIAGAITISLF